jgi:dihydroflavonol-4-reductase
MNTLSLVTGANGHLGNTLVRALLARGQQVRAGVRDPDRSAALNGLDCQVVRAELRDPDSLRQALQGVDVLYQVAAVFKHWASNPQAEIVDVNVQGTRNVLRAAAEAGVRRVVYVSSVAAVGHNGQRLDENSWNTNQDNPYYRSKILSERAAWETAQTCDLPMIAVLPSAIIGPHATRLTDTMGFLAALLARKLVLDPNFYFNFVDVRDVADGLIRAAEKGRPGQRYILANQQASSLAEVIGALNTLCPGYRLPGAHGVHAESVSGTATGRKRPEAAIQPLKKQTIDAFTDSPWGDRNGIGRSLPVMVSLVTSLADVMTEPISIILASAPMHPFQVAPPRGNLPHFLWKGLRAAPAPGW